MGLDGEALRLSKRTVTFLRLTGAIGSKVLRFMGGD